MRFMWTRGWTCGFYDAGYYGWRWVMWIGPLVIFIGRAKIVSQE